MVYTVFKLITIPSSTNEYGVGRTETWELIFDKVFEDMNEAKQYVIYQNILHSGLSNLLIGRTSEDKQNFIDEFCFGDNHLDLCRYFLGKPDTKKLFTLLQQKGTSVKKC